jgi:hypothetical protein
MLVIRAMTVARRDLGNRVQVAGTVSAGVAAQIVMDSSGLEDRVVDDGDMANDYVRQSNLLSGEVGEGR